MPKHDTAQRLAAAHRRVEPTIGRIVRLVAPHEDDEHEPIKLLEVNSATSPSGICPIAFTAEPPDIPYPSVVVEVTEDEYGQILRGALPLPEGWRLGDELYPAA